MKKIRNLLFVIIVIMISFSCSEDGDDTVIDDSSKELLIGKWKSTNGSGEYLTFNSDGRGLRKVVRLDGNNVVSNEWVFSWTLSNKTLTFNFDSETKLYSFEVSKIQLTIVDVQNSGDPKVYSRQLDD